MTDAFERIRERVTMGEAAGTYGFQVVRGRMSCPFHEDKTPSLKVYPGSRGWWCFGCAIGGSVIDFTARLFGLTLSGAAKKLDADFGLGIMGEPPDPVEMERRRAERQRREAEKRQSERLWRKNRDSYRRTVRRLQLTAPGPDRAELLGKLCYMDYWFEEYERKLREGRTVKSCSQWNLHTQRRISSPGSPMSR